MITVLRRNAVLLAALFLALGCSAVLLAVPARATPSYITGYHYYEGESYNPAFASSAFVKFHATNSRTQVWINGSVSCPAYNGAHVTRCAWYGNGTNLAHAGVNYTAGGQSFWFQVNVYAPVWYGNVRCAAHGNAGSYFVTYCAA